MGQVVTSVIVEANGKRIRIQLQIPRFCWKATGVVGNGIGLLVLRTAAKVVGRWSGSHWAKWSLR
jgi:hypothetical protein